MKNLIKHIGLGVLTLLVVGSCEMEEHPNFFSSDNLFDNPEGANTVLNGIYADLAAFNYYGADYHHLFNMTSGLYNTNRDESLSDAAGLKPFSSLNFVVNVWRECYTTISRANNLIENMEQISFPDEAMHANILGQAYFIRSLTYFNLVRGWGAVPLITSSVTTAELNFPRAPVDDVMAQIIADGEKAKELLPDVGVFQDGRPTKYAANMLLAKVYMWMAGNKTAGETPYWQDAYDEAIQVYGKFQLVQDFRSLWFEETGNNTSESIFELYSNDENTLRLHQLFTASNAHAGRATWGRFKPNLEVYDAHANRYPNDPRISSTYMTEYRFYSNETDYKMKITYPTTTKRNDKHQSYPFVFKYFLKDPTSLNYNQHLSYVIFRYADLLLMLAEIENELNGPDNAYPYVNEVLTRARYVSPDSTSNQPANWSGMTQETFRDSIMYEYQFELLGEGEDFFRVRRRGWDYFREHVIIAHNTHPLYDFTVLRDVEYPDNDRIMLLPVSQDEINANPAITSGDQNPGY